MKTTQDPLLIVEAERIQKQYAQWSKEIGAHRYAPWDPAEMLARSSRKRLAATLLHQADVFPRSGQRCLEIGYGTLGWLGDLISWGLRESDLYGIELDRARAQVAQQALPEAQLRVGDAGELPWDNETFKLVVASTVFTSILDERVRSLVAAEITRVIEPGGALLWYDFAVNNPRNPHVRKVTRPEVRRLFPTLAGRIRSVTLAPPIARRIAPHSWTLANCLEAIPLLRTHLLGVLVKPH